MIYYINALPEQIEGNTHEGETPDSGWVEKYTMLEVSSIEKSGAITSFECDDSEKAKLISIAQKVLFEMPVQSGSNIMGHTILHLGEDITF